MVSLLKPSRSSNLQPLCHGGLITGLRPQNSDRKGHCPSVRVSCSRDRPDILGSAFGHFAVSMQLSILMHNIKSEKSLALLEGSIG